jgi:chromosome segregation ATPase
MGLFDCEAHVNISDVENFQTSVNEFCNAVSNASYSIMQEIESAMAVVAYNATELEHQASECESIYEAIQEKKKNIEREVDALRKRLSNTPKTIEVTKEDGGVSQKPNPEYAQLEREIKKQQSRLSEIKALSWTVYNKKSEIAREARYVAGTIGELNSGARNVKMELTDLERKASSALNALSRTKTAISEYTNIRIRR